MHEKITGEEVRRWRKQNRWTLEKLGSVLGGLEKAQVSKLETGQRTISPAEDRLLRILIREEIPPEYLRNLVSATPGEIHLTQSDWNAVARLAARVGQSAEEWIAAKIREYLAERRILNPGVGNDHIPQAALA
jgi:transcriptional regulator with XRE-family HTH domain